MPLNPPLLLGQVVEVVVRCDSTDSQAGENVLHYAVTAETGSGVGLADAAQALYALFAAAYAPAMANSSVITAAFATIIGPGARSVTVRSTGAATPGTAGSGILPEQACGLVSKLTLTAGRHGRGRAFIPFPCSSDNLASGLPAATYITRLNTIGALIVSDPVVTVGANSSTLSSCLVTKARPALLVNTSPILASVSKLGWATQRRRSYYGRKNLPA